MSFSLNCRRRYATEDGISNRMRNCWKCRSWILCRVLTNDLIVWDLLTGRDSSRMLLKASRRSIFCLVLVAPVIATRAFKFRPLWFWGGVLSQSLTFNIEKAWALRIARRVARGWRELQRVAALESGRNRRSLMYARYFSTRSSSFWPVDTFDSLASNLLLSSTSLFSYSW